MQRLAEDKLPKKSVVNKRGRETKKGKTETAMGRQPKKISEEDVLRKRAGAIEESGDKEYDIPPPRKDLA